LAKIKPRRRDALGDSVFNGHLRIRRHDRGQMQVQPAAEKSARIHFAASVVAHGADPAHLQKPRYQANIRVCEKMLALQHIGRISPNLFQDRKETLQA